MLLAGLILLATCANLGSLFAARAADRSREMAIRPALGSTRGRILRQLLTEAVIVALVGGALGVQGAALLLHWLSGWRALPNSPIQVPVNPDVMTYAVALLLSIVSGALFGIRPVRQVLRSDMYQLVKAGGSGLPDELAPALFPARSATIALGVMGFLGGMLAVTGVFGMASYALSKRMRELGVRVALGSQRQEVLTGQSEDVRSGSSSSCKTFLFFLDGAHAFPSNQRIFL